MLTAVMYARHTLVHKNLRLGSLNKQKILLFCLDGLD